MMYFYFDRQGAQSALSGKNDYNSFQCQLVLKCSQVEDDLMQKTVVKGVFTDYYIWF